MTKEEDEENSSVILYDNKEQQIGSVVAEVSAVSPDITPPSANDDSPSTNDDSPSTNDSAPSTPFLTSSILDDQTINTINISLPLTKEAGVQVNLWQEVGGAEESSNLCNWQSVLILKFRRRLAEQEAINRRLLKEKDEQLRRITSNLLLLESKLRREQDNISRLLAEKEQKIGELDGHLRQLLRLNRRLAAGTRYAGGSASEQQVGGIIKRQDGGGGSGRRRRGSRRISWHNQVHVIHEYEENNIDTKETTISTNNNNVDEGQLFSREIDEACQAVELALEEAENSSFAAANNNISLSINCVIEQPPPLLSSGISLLSSSSSSSSDGDGSPVQDGLGVYNRIMNNHRTVTKPKDVKFKKISRVKSRSLEELRGRLRRPGLYFPPFIHEAPVHLEQEEII